MTVHTDHSGTYHPTGECETCADWPGGEGGPDLDHLLKTGQTAPDIGGRDVRISPRTLDDWQSEALILTPRWQGIVTELIHEVRHLRRELASALAQKRGGW